MWLESDRSSTHCCAIVRYHIIITSIEHGDRSRLLAQIRVPTQIIHGKADPLVPVAAGQDLAARIAGAEIDLIAGMGHDLPTELWPRFVSGIASAAGRA